MFPPFRYFKPKRIEEVTAFLAEHGESARILAGGTDLLVGMRRGEFTPDVLIDIKGIPELQNLSADNGTLPIGAAVSVNDLLDSAEVAALFPILIQTALRMASHQIRNRATVVGNLCNASPAADMGAALLALGARVTIASPRSRRVLPLGEFFTGVKKSALGRDEWVISVEADTPPPGSRMGFLKQARVRGPDLSTVNCAAVLLPDGALTLVLGAVAETPVVVTGCGSDKGNGIADRVREAIAPIDDVRGSAEYRMDLACLMTRRMVEKLTADSRRG
ncbi:MAG: xanthine dehydrogenase family protein subunit M [Candidatus Eisenbacteria sp.]|nr:xanthine dehydrogenase family protein subunit M [Candidatus Eisenbacteria bacterium]